MTERTQLLKQANVCEEAVLKKINPLLDWPRLSWSQTHRSTAAGTELASGVGQAEGPGDIRAIDNIMLVPWLSIRSWPQRTVKGRVVEQVEAVVLSHSSQNTA